MIHNVSQARRVAPPTSQPLFTNREPTLHYDGVPCIVVKDPKGLRAVPDDFNGESFHLHLNGNGNNHSSYHPHLELVVEDDDGDGGIKEDEVNDETKPWCDGLHPDMVRLERGVDSIVYGMSEKRDCFKLLYKPKD